MSFMLLVDQHLVLDRIRDWLKPGGKIIFFQAMFDRNYWFIDFIKPKLKYMTTVDFGSAIYKEDFIALLNKKNLSVSEYRLAKKEWHKGSYCMIVASIGDGRGSVSRGGQTSTGCCPNKPCKHNIYGACHDGLSGWGSGLLF